MRIECTTTFLDGRERFEAGDIFSVDETRGAYFVKNGWARPFGSESSGSLDREPASLSIQSVTHGQSADAAGVSNG